MFDELDADRDGCLTRDELLQGMTETTAKRLVLSPRGERRGRADSGHHSTPALLPRSSTSPASAGTSAGLSAKALAQSERP